MGGGTYYFPGEALLKFAIANSILLHVHPMNCHSAGIQTMLLSWCDIATAKKKNSNMSYKAC